MLIEIKHRTTGSILVSGKGGMKVATILEIACMYCGCSMGEKDGEGVSGVTTSICCTCWTARFPAWEYPRESKPENKEV